MEQTLISPESGLLTQLVTACCCVTVSFCCGSPLLTDHPTLLPSLCPIPTQIRNPLPMQDINLAISCMRLLHCHLDPDFSSPDSATLKELTDQQQATWIQCLFLFSLVWSVGGNTDEEGRRRFDQCLRKLITNDAPPELKPFVTGAFVKLTQPFPEGKLVRRQTGGVR